MIYRTLALAVVFYGSAAYAQSENKVAIKVGTIKAAEQCTFYQGIRYNSKSSSSGSSSAYASGSGSGYAGAYGVGGSAQFSAGGRSSYRESNTTSLETYFVKDCVSNFEGIRSAMQAALASSGAVIVGAGGYTLAGRIEEVVPVASGFAEKATYGQAYGSAKEGLKVTMSVTVADRAGRIVFGAPVTAEIETGSASTVRGTVQADVSSGEGRYSLLQREVAMMAARRVAFHFSPLVVVGGGGKNVRLNHGGALLEAGTMISIMSLDGSSAATYRITAAGDGNSFAQQIGDANSAGVLPGSKAYVIEKNDPAANQSVLQRVELP